MNTLHAIRLAGCLERDCEMNWPDHDNQMNAAALLRTQHARITELEAQLEAIGAGGVEPLRKSDGFDALARKGQWIDEQYAHKLALELECMLIAPERNWDSAAKLLDEYKSAWDEINPSPSPFGSDFAVPPERKAIYAAIKAKRAATIGDKP